MEIVNQLYDQTLHLDDYEPKHVGLLLERVSHRMRHDMGLLDADHGLRERFPPLRPVHFRLLSLVPTQGATLTELSAPAGMTKQALGQFVEVLVAHGYLAAGRSPTDGRARIVTRTPRGDEVVLAIEELYDRLHARWREVLGPAEWARFRASLERLAVGWDRDD